VVKRSIKSIIPTHTVLEGGGFKVRRPVAMGSLMSPFLLLDEMGPVNYGPREAIGAPSHPHRGFETVTYMLEGAMQHADSAGNSGDLNPGDVQWMTAGRGIIHSELPHPDFYEAGGKMHGFQIWVNLPAKDKMMLPRYQDIPSEDLPTVESTDGKVWAKIIAGEAMDAKAVIDTVIPIQFIHFRMKQDAELVHHVGNDLNAMMYMFGGSAKIAGETVEDGQLVLLDGGSEIDISTESGAEFLLLAGPEINEPIARYGPFVMNTRQEIHQAIIDYQNGTLA
tara:strand:+ start:3447 stop:4286 length:840 start_codon:yes stop_codon:yes gene_type:complete